MKLLQKTERDDATHCNKYNNMVYGPFMTLTRPDFMWLEFDRGSGAPAKPHEIKWRCLETHPSSSHIIILCHQTLWQKRTAKQSHAWRPKIYFFLSGLELYFLFFPLLFFPHPLYPPSMKGAIKQPEMMLVNKSFGGRGIGGWGVGEDGEKKTLKDKGRQLIRGGKLRRGCVVCVRLFDH